MYCVIVGDIVASQTKDAQARDVLLQAAKAVFERINTDYRDGILAGFGMVRGDAFEGVLLSQYLAPRIVQQIIKAFYEARQTRVRISVVVGELTTVSSNRNEADGPAFPMAFEAIEHLKAKKSAHWLQVSMNTNSIGQPLVDGLLTALAALTEGWTDRQREIAWAMESLSDQQKLVAKRLNVSASAVSKALKAANYAAYRQAWQALEQYFQDVEEAAVSELKAPPPSYAAYLSVARRKLDQRDFLGARALYKRALELAISSLGEDDLRLVPIYLGLTFAIQALGDYEGAEVHILKALALQADLPKDRLEYTDTLDIYSTLKESMGDHEHAEQLRLEAIEIARGEFGEDHLSTIGYYNNLAVLYSNMGKSQESLEYYIKCADYFEKHPNVNVLSSGVAYSNISIAYYKSGNAPLAMEYVKKAIDILENNLPPTHPELIGAIELQTKLERAQHDLESDP